MGSATAFLLQEAALLHRQGALAEAATRYQQVLHSEPANPDALYHLAVLACQQGRLQQGVEFARRVLLIDPRRARCHNLLGMALSGQGRPEEALASFDQAIALEPDFAEAHGNRANALSDLGRYEQAVVSYERAVALDAASIGDWFNRGVALHQVGRHDEAIASYHRVLALQSNFPNAHFNLGTIFAKLNRDQEALASYDQVLALHPRHVEALVNRGNVLLKLGRAADALASFEAASAADPDAVVALKGLAKASIAQGDMARGLPALVRALQLDQSDDTKALFVACVKYRRFRSEVPGIRALLLSALLEVWDRPTQLEYAATSVVKLNPAIAGCCRRAADAWPHRLSAERVFGTEGPAPIAQDRLLRAVLESAPVCDVELERLLTGMRRILLDQAVGSPASPLDGDLLEFYCALARQCFINEYVFDCTTEELERVGLLHERLTGAFASGAVVSMVAVIAIAAYGPLHLLEGAEALLKGSWPAPVAALIKQQIAEPKQEQSYRDAIRRLTPVSDTVSLRVKAQYEQNPYPRWVKVAPAARQLSIEEYFGPWYRSDGRESIDVLVAGCGTGQSLIETAQRLRGAEVLAVDLSVASLCYAMCQAHAAGLANITFAEADILALGTLGRTFDVIESSGVLHHLADPWAGWRILLGLLRPGGLMNVGLYSRLARRNINAARALIAARGYSSTAEDIRSSRQEILGLPDGAPAKDVSAYPDFFTISECRDVLFHVQEHQMTLPEIDAFIAHNALEFLGFTLDADVLLNFRSRFAHAGAMSDLALWHSFETDNPDTFAGMYHFWLRKKE